VVNRFSCGKPVMDRWIKNKAKKSAARREHRVFTAHDGNDPKIVGYYALQLGSESVEVLAPEGQKTYLQNYTAFPAVHLSYLAVHANFKRQGMGRYLLMDAFFRTAQIAEYAGFYAFTLQSLDEESTAFYKSLGFATYTEDAASPKMLMPLQNILDLVALREKEKAEGG
jgi:GNAT superfamily N-acetyltransferase